MPVTVLESVEPPGDRTNPYLPLLVASLPDHVEVSYFSWRRALLGRFDVFHLHWPEVRLRGRTPVRSVLRWAAFGALLLRIRLGRKALVRTLHNVAPHDPLPPVPRALLARCERWTTLWIALSDQTPAPAEGPVVVAPHGHYRDWFRDRPRGQPVPGRVLHVGLLRRYKGIDALLSAFMLVPGDELELRVVGEVIDAGVAEEVRAASRSDARISFRPGYLPDDDLVAEITASELVVLPFGAVSNSGSLLLALSLDRPVLVPSGPMTDRLASEVGPGWVHTYDGALAPRDLEDALASVRSPRGRSRPDLSEREWGPIGVVHAAAFETAVQLARRPGRRHP